MEFIDLQIQIPFERSSELEECISDANDGIGKGDERWRLLWRDPMQQEHLQAIEELVHSLQPCKNLLVLGIGGSSLGTRALHAALCTNNDTQLFVLDNVDPVTFNRTIENISSNDPSLSQTVVAVVSKSGETAEVAALYMAVSAHLPDATYIAITGKSGALREYAMERDWAILPVPEGVGGRFSVLSPVGLLPAAMCGIDIAELLEGAKNIDDACMQLQDNPAANLADGLVSAMRTGHTIHVMMPYCDRLSPFANWYVQLWAESLGKIDNNQCRVGATPVAAVGTTDQHSMLQLWREGPTDKVIGFVNVANTIDVPLENNVVGTSQSWLSGTSLHALLDAEQKGTEQAVRDAGQFTWSLTLPELTPYYVGQYIALWQNTVAIAGRLLGVNPYNQPGVELGKKLTKDSFS